VSPVKYELGFYIPEDDILHSSLKCPRCEGLQSDMVKASRWVGPDHANSRFGGAEEDRREGGMQIAEVSNSYSTSPRAAKNISASPCYYQHSGTITAKALRSHLWTVHIYVRFGGFTAVTMKDVVFWVVRLCVSCKNRRFLVHRFLSP
jgi:hypothetical protein